MQPSQQSDDPNVKNSQAITKFLPLMLGYFSLSVPSGLSLYWFTNNALSTAQQVWLQKYGGARIPALKLSDDTSRKEQPQIRKSVSEATIAKKKDGNPTSDRPHQGERFKQLKEQEARRRQQREEEKRRAEVAANRKEDKSVEIESRNKADSINGEFTSLSHNAFTSENYRVVNGDSTSSEVKEDEGIQTAKIPADHNHEEDQHVSDKRNRGETVTCTRATDNKLPVEDAQEDRSE